MFDQPPVIIVFVTVAAVMAFIEIALPTLGVAGTIAGGCVLAAIAAIARQDADAWPLAGCVVAFAVWALLIAGGKRHLGAELGTATLYGVSGIGFAIANEDWPSVFVSLVAAGLMAAAYPRVHAAA